MTNGNEAAFARPIGKGSFDGYNDDQEGCTKREWMATMALVGLRSQGLEFGVKEYAEIAVEQADALITALNRPMCPDCKTRFADDGHYDAEHKICPDYERAWSERQ